MPTHVDSTRAPFMVLTAGLIAGSCAAGPEVDSSGITDAQPRWFIHDYGCAGEVSPQFVQLPSEAPVVAQHLREHEGDTGVYWSVDGEFPIFSQGATISVTCDTTSNQISGRIVMAVEPQ